MSEEVLDSPEVLPVVPTQGAEAEPLATGAPPRPTGKAAREPLGRDFHLLWLGQSISNAGDRITLFVVPTLMIVAIGATPFAIGVVSTGQYLAIPLFSLVAGVLIDRWDIRRLLIACDLIRMAVIAVIPVAYWLGVLSVPLLFGCVVGASAATVFFNIGYLPMVTTIVSKDNLVPANSRMETSRTVAEVAGPSLAAGLYAGLGVGALLADAGTFLFSAANIFAMKPTFGERTRRGTKIWPRLKLGIAENWADPVLRRCTAGTLGANIGGPIFVTVMPVLVYRGLGLSVATLGFVMSGAAVGAVVGSLVAPRMSRLVGTARLQSWAILLHSACGFGILLTVVLNPAVVLTVTLGFYGFFMVWYNVCSQSVRQARMPAADQAVIFAAYRTITWGVIPISTFSGGIIVTLLARHFSIEHAAMYAMLAATVIGMFAFVPLAGVQRLLDAGVPYRSSRPAAA